MALNKCVICKRNADKHHVRTKGAGGTDDDFNLMSLCRWHHTEIHQIGITKMRTKYIGIEKWLTENNWSWDKASNGWIHFIQEERKK